MLVIEFYKGSEIQIPSLNVTQNDHTVEDAITLACKAVNIKPVSCSLFGLQIKNSHLYLALSQKLDSLPKENLHVYFRLRHHPQSLERLNDVDEKAFHYLYWQVRDDFLQGKFSFTVEDDLGLAVADIIHHIVSTSTTLSQIEIKNFLPSSLNKITNRFNVKNTVEKHLTDASNSSPAFIKLKYLEKVIECTELKCDDEKKECLPVWGCEVLLLEQIDGTDTRPVRVMVAPFHPRFPGISFSGKKKGGWSLFCDIIDLVVLPVRMPDNAIEIARKCGVPSYFVMPSRQSLYSFISCLSGYYRLLKCWTFDLCKEVPTPIIKTLHKIKCHGPIGASFAHSKLLQKADSESGVAILRQSSQMHSVYKLDVTDTKARSIVTYTLRPQGGVAYTIEGPARDSSVTHSCLTEALKALSLESDSMTVNGAPLFKRLLQPSDYDKPELLLLCANFDNLKEKHEDNGPRVFCCDSFIPQQKVPINGSFYKIALATLGRDTSRQYVVKLPTIETLEQNRKFLAMSAAWLKLEGDPIVRAFGVILSPCAIVMEWVPLGPLDIYLREHHDVITEVDLLEAVTHLAKALWILSQVNFQHNNIRCSSMLVHSHKDNIFHVKLSDPGDPILNDSSIHWIPREHHAHPPTSKTDPSTDVWAFATTSWQIFSRGETPIKGGNIDEIKDLYMRGHVLPRPENCPLELYQVMIRCWSPDVNVRKQPQAIVRDTFQLLYQVFNSRRHNTYSTINETDTNYGLSVEDDTDEMLQGDVSCSSTLSRADTYNPIYQRQKDGASVHTTFTTLSNEGGACSDVTLVSLSLSDSDTIVEQQPNTGAIPKVNVLPTLTPMFRHQPGSQNSFTAGPSGMTSMPVLPPITRTKQADGSVTLSDVLVPPPEIDGGQLAQGKKLKMDRSIITIGAPVGEGNYGWVYKGTMATPGQPKKDVAVKTLKVVTGQHDDMGREIDILKMLQHQNIVHLMGVIQQNDTGSAVEERLYMVMEYLPMGSLKTYLLENRTITDNTLLDFALDIARGMDYLESKRVVHRDLAARNILVASSPLHVKISDFGLAQQVHNSGYYVYRTQRDLPLPWYAPESIAQPRYSHKTDVWSYGVTCWEMFTRGKEPDLPRNANDLLRVLEQGRRLNCVSPCPEKIYSRLMRVCWDHEPRCRPNFSDLQNIVSELKEEIME